MPDAVVTPNGFEADVGRLINRVADADSNLRSVVAQLESAGDTDPQFFDLIRAVSSSAAEGAYYTRACLKHLQQLLGTDRHSARGAPSRQQELAQGLQPAAAHQPAAPTHADAALIAELTTSCFPDQAHETTRDGTQPVNTRTGSLLPAPPQLSPMTRSTPEVA